MREEKKRVVPQKLSREVYRSLEGIVGKHYISEDWAIIKTNSNYRGIHCEFDLHCDLTNSEGRERIRGASNWRPL